MSNLSELLPAGGAAKEFKVVASGTLPNGGLLVLKTDGTVEAINGSNLTSTNFVGTSTKAFTNGQTATIVPQGGVSTNQSSLTTGTTYYVQTDGTLATSAGDPSVEAGKAISTTSLLIKGNS
jgi:hypothetical protein